MINYDYRQALKEDIIDYLQDMTENDKIRAMQGVEDRDDLVEYLEELFWTVDSITGNGSGSYTFNAFKAEEYLCHNWDLMQECAEEYSIKDIFSAGAEGMDVSIRCYLLCEVLNDIIDDDFFNNWFVLYKTDDNG